MSGQLKVWESIAGSARAQVLLGLETSAKGLGKAGKRIPSIGCFMLWQLKK